MALFPDMPVPVPQSNGAGAGLEPGGSSGVVSGLDASLINLLNNYRPGDIGICELADQLQLSLPYPEWHLWGSAVSDNPSLTAGQSGTVTMWTVPEDERAWLYGYKVKRETGDNKMVNLALVMAAGYAEGPASVPLIEVATSVIDLWWPDPAGILTATGPLGFPPILIEPGSRLTVSADGTGVSASTFRVNLILTRMKLGRAMAPK